jgi:UDP-N-acetylglucosamine 2-epimerase (non-hydrolysing)
MKRIISVVGARPNFMKVAPLDREFRNYSSIEHLIIHTGQHYNPEMSDVFFEQLGISEPARDLGVGSGRHGEMTGKIMTAFEEVCLELRPDLVIVVGDVNSTIAASLVARKLFIPVAHVEAGLRSFDETMPEEINRRLTDCLSNLLFVSEPSGMDNLKREGVYMDRAHLVGDIMLETLTQFLPIITSLNKYADYGLDKGSYALVTVHRPSNTDSPEALEQIIGILESIPFPTLFPVHPRTCKRAEEFGLKDRLCAIKHLKTVAPSPYIEFLSLMQSCKMVFSDSGSIQAEAAFFDVPCLVARENTERPIYQELGSSVLVGRDKGLVADFVEQISHGAYKHADGSVCDLGKNVAKKIARITAGYLNA